MPDESLSLSELPSTNPVVAYAADVARLGRPSIGVQDDAWLILALALSRLPILSAGERRTAMLEAADALAVSALASGHAPTSSILRVASALRALYDVSAIATAGHDPIAETAYATQSVVEDLEIAGGFALAYATLASLETAFRSVLPPRIRGNIVAQQGRAVRQLGLIDVARDLYTAVIAQGDECDAKDVVARGLHGVAVIALTRGNYPAARDYYERALANAEAAQDHDLIRSAHHGLMNCGFASGDLDSAMVHGWNVLRLSIHPDTRAEALLNMAEVCRLTGEYEAALRVFRVAIEWTSVSRVRLHALSGALQTAIVLHRVAEINQYRREIAQLMPTIAEPYTLAMIGLEFADALYRLGERACADETLAKARALAVAQSYHEIVHRAEQTAALWRAPVHAGTPGGLEMPQQPTPRRSEHFRTVLRSLNGLTASSL